MILTIRIRFTYGGRMGMRLICLACMNLRRIFFTLNSYFIIGSRNCMWFSSSSAHNDYAHNSDTKNHNNPNHHSNYQRKPTSFRRRCLCLVGQKVVSLSSIEIGKFTLGFFQVGAFTITCVVIAISEPIGKFINYLCITSLNG